MAFGTRKKGMKDEGKGGRSVKEETKNKKTRWPSTQPAVVYAIVVSVSRRDL